MSELDDIRARIPNIPEADMSRAERDRARLLAAVDAVMSLADDDMVGWSYKDAVTHALENPTHDDKDRNAA